MFTFTLPNRIHLLSPFYITSLTCQSSHRIKYLIQFSIYQMNINLSISIRTLHKFSYFVGRLQHCTNSGGRGARAALPAKDKNVK
jgi:hypothetical protein